jgi:hypothetical protein
MLSEVVLDITRKRVTPVSGEGALGKWRAPGGARPRLTRRVLTKGKTPA